MEHPTPLRPMRHLMPLRYVEEVARAGSIRRAAETLAITASALNRRILSLEHELGVPIFERLPRGVRLNTAGEILLHHIRNQVSDMARVRSQIADLSGVRRGHVSIACAQALMPHFLPRQIEAYRSEHPAVTFNTLVRDRDSAERALADYSADIALIFEPSRFADFQTIMTIRQPVHCVMAADHPLAGRAVVRLGECLNHPLALPAAPDGLRFLLEGVASRAGAQFAPAVESDSYEFLLNYAAASDIISFQIPLGIPEGAARQDLASRLVDPRDVPPTLLYMGQLRGRVLPIAAARFADQLAGVFAAEFDAD